MSNEGQSLLHICCNFSIQHLIIFYLVGLKSSPSAPSSAATIIFESIEAVVKSSGRNSFYLQFHSMCLSGEIEILNEIFSTV